MLAACARRNAERGDEQRRDPDVEREPGPPRSERRGATARDPEQQRQTERRKGRAKEARAVAPELLADAREHRRPDEDGARIQVRVVAREEVSLRADGERQHRERKQPHRPAPPPHRGAEEGGPEHRPEHERRRVRRDRRRRPRADLVTPRLRVDHGDAEARDDQRRSRPPLPSWRRHRDARENDGRRQNVKVRQGRRWRASLRIRLLGVSPAGSRTSPEVAPH